MARSKLAVWSFVLVLFAYLLIGVFYIASSDYPSFYNDFLFVLFNIGGLISVVTLILGIVTFRKIKKKKLKGKGLAIATIILSLIVISFFVWLYYMFYQLAKVNFD